MWTLSALTMPVGEGLCSELLNSLPVKVDGLKMPLAGSDCETVWIAHSQTVRSHNRQLNKANKTYHSAKSQSTPTKA